MSPVTYLSGKAERGRLALVSRSCYSFARMVSPLMLLISMKLVPSAAMPLWAMNWSRSMVWVMVAVASRLLASVMVIVFIFGYLVQVEFHTGEIAGVGCAVYGL